MKVLQGKIKRRLTRLAAALVPYNKRYKALGFYRTSQEYIHSEEGKGARCIEVEPGNLSHQVIPKELNDACLRYYKSAEQVKIPPSLVTEVLEGREYQDVIFGGTILSKQNKVIGDISYYEPNPNGQGRRPVEANSIFTRKYFAPPKHYPGVVFSCVIGFNGGDNYYHWMFDCLTKLHLLRKSSLYHTVNWFLMPEPREIYHREMLHLLSIPPEKIIFEQENIHIRADKIIASFTERPYNHTPAWMFGFLRESFLRKDIVKDTGFPFVYISRSDSHRRNVVNEDELMAMLTPYGFKKFTLAPLSFVEKVNVFASAAIIVAPHGAGLANLTFCPPGSTLIELFNDRYICACYSEMALKVGMNYHYFIFDHIPAGKPISPVEDHILADVDRIREVLEKVMEIQRSLRQNGRARG